KGCACGNSREIFVPDSLSLIDGSHPPGQDCTQLSVLETLLSHHAQTCCTFPAEFCRLHTAAGTGVSPHQRFGHPRTAFPSERFRLAVDSHRRRPSQISGREPFESYICHPHGRRIPRVRTV